MLANWIHGRFQVNVRRTCRLAGFSKSGWYKRSTAREQSALRLRIREIEHARPRFGYPRIHVMLRREGWRVNRKRVYRWYRLEGLQLRVRMRRRKHMYVHRGAAPRATRTNERWSMDFVHDQLIDGRPIRMLTVVDQLSRQTISSTDHEQSTESGQGQTAAWNKRQTKVLAGHNLFTLLQVDGRDLRQSESMFLLC